MTELLHILDPATDPAHLTILCTHNITLWPLLWQEMTSCRFCYRLRMMLLLFFAITCTTIRGVHHDLNTPPVNRRADSWPAASTGTGQRVTLTHSDIDDGQSDTGVMVRHIEANTL